MENLKTRLESDSIGTLEVPADAYYGVQTLRAKYNFNISGRKMSPLMIESLAEIKKASAIANKNAGALNTAIADAIIRACDDIIAGHYIEEFIIDPIQGGAGTSANMNANEVIANRAIELLGGVKGDYSIVHPNDHVNMGQSTNDVYPTSGKLTILKLIPKLLKELSRLSEALDEKSIEFDNVVKMGRTQLQDAVPIRLGQSFKCYGLAVSRDIKRISKVLNELRAVNMGATAIGTTITACPEYLENIVGILKEVTGLDIVKAENLIDSTQNLDGLVNISSTMKVCAVSLSKMSNDLRLLSSGPRTGFNEINLPAMQNGSSIMPGKVNPVIPEVVSQVAFNVIGNDMTITMAAEAGQMELNAFEPIIFYNMFEQITTLTGACQTFTDNCIKGITANRERCKELVEGSVGIITALCPYIGYKKAADIAKQSLKENIPVRELILKADLLSKEQLETLLDPYAMTNPSSISPQDMISLAK